MSVSGRAKRAICRFTPTSFLKKRLARTRLRRGVYRIINFLEPLNLQLNGKPIRRYVAVKDGDTIEVPANDISFSFFSLASKSSLITMNREPHIVAPFIESAALDAAVSPKRDDAKAFLREFVRELSREIHWTTKFVVLLIVLATLGGVFYLGSSYNSELQRTRELAERQSEVVRRLEEQLAENNAQLGLIDKSNKDIIKTVSWRRICASNTATAFV
jgi:hypothetical protein